MTNELRAAAERALVQMDGVWGVGLTGGNVRQFEAARDALRLALAEQPQPSCVCGEPSTLGVVHRADGPCYVAEQPQPERRSSGNDVLVSRELIERMPRLDLTNYFHSDVEELSTWAADVVRTASLAPQPEPSARVAPVRDSRCDYVTPAGKPCRKCGRVHDGGRRFKPYGV